MTWDELAIKITCEMTDKQRNTDVTFFDNRDEFFGIKSLEYTGDFVDVLDANHPFLTTL